MKAMKKTSISKLHSTENCEKRLAMKTMKFIADFKAPKNGSFLRYEALKKIPPPKGGKMEHFIAPYFPFRNWGARA